MQSAGCTPTVLYGSDPSNKYITTYFRRTFNVTGAGTFSSLSLQVRRDDGVVVYLNGAQAASDNMPGTVDYSTPALTSAGDDGNSWLSWNLNPSFLVEGTNVVAVEIHQNVGTSSDISFDLQLDGVQESLPDPAVQKNLDLLEDLRITEIMYNAPGGADYDFVELRNVGSTTLDLTGVRLTDGIEFTFPAMNLAAGQYVVVAANLAAFQARYGATINVAGQYADSLSNGGEHLVLRLAAPYDAAMLRFDYDDVWLPSTDGGGYALVIRDAAAHARTWDEAASWQAGTVPFGSPGRGDGDPAPLAVAVDVLATSDSTPPLSGTVTSPTATVQVTVGGNTYNAVNHGDGTWTLANGAIAAPLADGVYNVLATATVGPNSVSDTTTGELTIDTTPPAVSVDALTTSDSTPPLSGTINDSSATLTVTVAGNTYPAVNHGNGVWSLADNVVAPPLAGGSYNVLVTATDALGNVATDTTTNELTIGAAAPLAVRIFYNNSLWDGNNPAANASDDAAIAPDKAALLPGGTATFANYTSFSKGINGLMIDYTPAGAISSADFSFRTGNNNSVGTWNTLATAPSVSLRSGAGTGGSTRITLIWPDATITKRWLQVTILANANTGLASPYVFYFGNAVGDTGNSTTDAVVNAADEIGARAHPVGPFPTAAITDRYDFNRDRLVNATDQILARTNSTNPLTSMRLIAPPAESGSGAGAALASELTVDASLVDLLAGRGRRRRW